MTTRAALRELVWRLFGGFPRHRWMHKFHETDLDGRSWEWQRVLCSVDPVGHRT
jgi:hypothetical protein